VINPENIDEDVVVPGKPARPRLAEEPQGGTTITVAIRTPERLRPRPDLAPRVPPIVISSLKDLAWQLPTSTASPGFEPAGAEARRHGSV
jgi:hypothetical protein